MELHVDDREFLIERLPELPQHSARRLTVGDYAILFKGCLLACIERKTLDDYGSSLKDGRHANREKMLEMRAKTGCRVYYIIEGRPPKDPAVRCGGIPYRHILSSIDHIMYRDGIFVINTLDQVDTARRLGILMENLATLGETLFTGLSEIPDLSAELSARREKSREEVVRNLWACFRGISVESAQYFAQKWSLAAIIRGEISRSDISAHKSAGRTISRKCADGLISPDRPTEIRLLSSIPGISRERAATILTEKSLKDLLAMPREEISPLGGKKRLGATVITGMFNLFESVNYQFPQDAQD